MRKRNSKADRSAQQQRRPAATEDDRNITALKLKLEQLTPEMAAYFAKCEEKLGFVPNVLKAYAFDMPKLSAFVAMYNDLMLAPSGLSKLEREMIAVAVSAQNRCYYCLVAHGAAVRQLSGDPPLGELMVMNYRAARLSQRERAMLDFTSPALESVEIPSHVADSGDAVCDKKRQQRLLGPRRISIDARDVSVHIPQAGDEIFAMGVDDLSGLRFESGAARNAGDSIAIHDYGCVGLDFAVHGVDNFGVGNGKSLRLSAKCQQRQGEKKFL